MADACPGCGAEACQAVAAWECESFVPDDGGRNGLVRYSRKCVERQLAQTKARISELEANVLELQTTLHEEYRAFALRPGTGISCGDNSCVQGNPPRHVGTNGGCTCTRVQLRGAVSRLRKDLAAMGAVVRAAVNQAVLADNVADYNQWEWTKATEATEDAVRALPPELAEKWGGV